MVLDVVREMRGLVGTTRHRLNIAHLALRAFGGLRLLTRVWVWSRHGIVNAALGRKPRLTGQRRAVSVFIYVRALAVVLLVPMVTPGRVRSICHISPQTTFSTVVCWFNGRVFQS